MPRVGQATWPSIGQARLAYPPLMALLAVLILTWALVVGWLAFERAIRQGRVGADLTLYVEATEGWLAGGSFYLESQLAGPYVITFGDILYPPSTIPLFVPFLVLPASLFLVLPLAALLWVIVRQRPAPWTWPAMALCLAFTPTLVKLIHFNPFMWCAAAVALGTLYAWPSVFVMLKPTLAPFALIGIRRRSWWVAAASFVLVVLAFWPMWPDYLTVLANARNESGLLYNASDVPLLLIPVIAWFGATSARAVPVPTVASATASGAAAPVRPSTGSSTGA